MTRSTFVACSLTVLAGMAASAQTPVPPGLPQPRPTETAQTVTLTGCLKPYDPTTMQVGSDASSTSAPGPQQYVLTDAESGTAAAKPATTAPGAAEPPSGSTPISGAHDTYLLKPGAAMDFAPHVNHKVQVMGTLVVDAMARPGATTGATGTSGTGMPAPTTGAGGAPTTTAGAAAAKTSLTVMSITMVQKTCS